MQHCYHSQYCGDFMKVVQGFMEILFVYVAVLSHL